jgi:hypothetical protein
MANYLLVEVDTNDGDYVTAFNPISDTALENVKLLIEKIKENPNRHNFPYEHDDTQVYDLYADLNEYGSTVDQDIAIDTFIDYVPSTEYGFHTVTRVELYDVGHVDGLLYKK